MNTSTGVIYDPEAIERMEDYAQQQSEFFLEAEQTAQKKEWVYLALIATVSASVVLITFSVLYKKKK